MRLVVQFIRTPSLTPVGSGKAKNEHPEVVLYLCLHWEVPSIGSQTGKSLHAADQTRWSSWDTSVLLYGFKAAARSQLAKENKPSVNAWMHLGSKVVADAGTPVSEQEPDGDGSLFVTLGATCPMSDLLVCRANQGKRGRVQGVGMTCPNSYHHLKPLKPLKKPKTSTCQPQLCWPHPITQRKSPYISVMKHCAHGVSEHPNGTFCYPISFWTVPS